MLLFVNILIRTNNNNVLNLFEKSNTFENSERKILKVRKVSKTKDKYPRSFSQIKKNPLK